LKDNCFYKVSFHLSILDIPNQALTAGIWHSLSPYIIHRKEFSGHRLKSQMQRS